MATRNPHRQPSFIKWFVFALILCWLGYRLENLIKDEIPTASERQTVRVLRVVDGDTLQIEGEQRVRLLGIDTPETKHPTLPPQPFGLEATQFTKGMVEGKTVELVFDKERFDDYQRILAFVFVDEKFLNEELVAAGLATAQPQYPYRNDFKKRFTQAEEIAKSNRIGIWSLEP